ncbi:MAG: nodulation protein NfeD, partial [bacterium]|nr:nodulation protein NfeD [bacterium]
SKGAFTAGGIVALITGSLLLFDLPDDMPGINWAVIAGVVVSTVLFFVFVVAAGVKALKNKVATGEEGMVGTSGEVVVPCEPAGTVYVRGELWRALSETPLPKGTIIVVTKVDDTVLYVAPK